MCLQNELSFPVSNRKRCTNTHSLLEKRHQYLERQKSTNHGRFLLVYLNAHLNLWGINDYSGITKEQRCFK